MDLNTFSKINNQDNVGLAGRIVYDFQKKVNDNWILKQEIRIESVSSNFERIERFREVEFERNWNIQQLIVKGKSNIKFSKNYILIILIVVSLIMDLTLFG